jgi:hypothetical protein
MKRMILVIAVLAAGLTGATAAWALGPVDIGAGGGPSPPTGDFGDAFDTGFHLRAMGDFTVIGFPFGLRGVASYEDFGATESGAVTGGSCKVTSLAGGLTLNILQLGPVQPYLVGTGGVYWTDTEVEVGGETQKSDDSFFGLEFGVGVKVKLLGLNFFVEARYEDVFVGDDGLGPALGSSDIQAVPVTFGILF